MKYQMRKHTIIPRKPGDSPVPVVYLDQLDAGDPHETLVCLHGKMADKIGELVRLANLGAEVERKLRLHARYQAENKAEQFPDEENVHAFMGKIYIRMIEEEKEKRLKT